jgi:Bacterial protein of unknown function (DUF937)/PRC-barrel domain
MTANIVSAVSQFLTPDLIAKIASASGLSDRTTTQKAVGVAVPAILSSLANLASKPEGAQQLAGTIAKQSPNVLENLASTIGESGQLADTGKNALSSLLGWSTFGSLAKTIARFAGVGEGATSSILGMVTPIILGVLGREAGPGVSGLTRLLSSQKDNFAAAMPAGLSNLLRGSGLLDETNTIAPVASRPNQAYRTTSGDATARVMSNPAPKSTSWAYWVLPLLALAGLAWYLLGGERTSRPVAIAPQANTTLPVQGSVADGDLGRQITAVIDSLGAVLPGVKDQASLNEALPKLQRAAGELDRLSDVANRLPVEARDRLAETLKTATTRLKTGLDTINAMPLQTSNVKPVIANLQTKLAALAMTPGSIVQQRVATFLTRAEGSSIAVSAYFDRGVYNGAGEKIGAISDLIVTPDARIVAAVIGVGGFLGIGEKAIAVPFSSMKVQRRDGDDWQLVMGATKDELEAAPTFEGSGLRLRLSPALQPK